MPKHRGHGEGSIVQRPNGRWQAQISVQGKRLSQTLPTKSEALRWIRDQQARLSHGVLNVQANKITLGSFLDQWLTTVRRSVRPKTLEQYQYVVRLHLQPMLGKTKLAELRPDHLDALYEKKLSDGLSTRTVRHIHVVAHNALNNAVRWGDWQFETLLTTRNLPASDTRN